MALPTNGTITMYQVKQEFILATDLEFKLEDLRTVGTGSKEVKIGGVWRTLNPCSPVSPSVVAPFYLSDWYGYNHAAVCCEPPRKVVIRPYNSTYPIVTSLVLQIPSGGGNVGLGFYLSWEGSALGAVITWSISWFGGLDSGQGTAAITATFNSAMTYYSFVKATVTNGCGTSESQVIAVSFEGGGGVCTPPSNVVITRNSSTAPISLIANTPTNLVFNTTFSGTSSGATYLWQAWGEQNIVPDSTNPANATASFNMAAGSQGWVKCTVSNNCGTVISNVIGVSTGNTPCYGNQPQTFSIIKTCLTGETGSTHTKSIAENTYCAATLGDANILAYNAARDAATNEMNSIGSCTPNGTCPVNLSSVSISVSPTTIIFGQSFTLTVLLSVVGAGAVTVNVVEGYGASNYYSYNTINGSNSITYTITPTGIIGNTYGVYVNIELVNKGNCTNTSLTSNTAFVAITAGCNPNIWRFIGNPYCIGTTQKQVRENQCGTQEEVTIENNSPACIIGSTKNYSKISVLAINGTPHFRTTFQIDNFPGSGGTVKLRYCTGSSFICSFAPPTSDYTIPEGLASVDSQGRWSTGELITFRIWFDGVAGFEDKTVTVQNS